MRQVAILSILIVTLIICPSCSVYMAAHQPDKKDMSVLHPGTHQSDIRAELGTPAWTGQEGDLTVDIFKFTQGYSKGAKAGRAFFHGAADILTIGMWEVVGTPVESIADGEKVTVKVCYDENLCVKTVDVRGDKAATPAGPAPETAQGSVR